VKRDLLTLDDLSPEEIRGLVRDALRIKRGDLDVSRAMAGKVLGMIFQKPSTRTRVSFEVAALQMGGHAIYMGWEQLQLARGETIADTARVLSRYLDVIVARVYSHGDLVELAKYATVPVINGLSNEYHPVQALSDLLTMYERFGRLEGLKLAFIGDGGSNVCHSLLLGCSKVGVNVSLGVPKRYMPDRGVLERAMRYARESGAEIAIHEDPREAVKGADVVYTDVFVSMGFESEGEERLKTFLPRYQVNRELLKHVGKEFAFMHCLPAHRGEEVTDEVIDGPESIVWDQAENRLHMQKAILRWILGQGGG